MKKSIENYEIVKNIQCLFGIINNVEGVPHRYQNPSPMCGVLASGNCYCWTYAYFFDVFQVTGLRMFKAALYSKLKETCTKHCSEYRKQFDCDDSEDCIYDIIDIAEFMEKRFVKAENVKGV